MQSRPQPSGKWLALRRPLQFMAIFGCAVSLAVSGRLSLRLAAPATIYGAFVPVTEIVGLALVWPWKRPPFRFAEAIDSFCASHTAWLLWLCGFATAWGFFPPDGVFLTTRHPLIWYGSAIAAALWSALADWRFFRSMPERTPLRATLLLGAQRAVSWTLALAWFAGPAAWQVAAHRLGI